MEGTQAISIENTRGQGISFRASMVKRPEEYKWSSHPGYVGMEKEALWVEYAWVLSKFGNDIKKGREKYRKYVEEELKKGIEETPLKTVQV